MFYGLEGKMPLSLEEIGDRFDLTRERVRQIKEKAIRRLKHTSKNVVLKSYLDNYKGSTSITILIVLKSDLS